MTSNDVNFNDCPIGIKNSENVKHLAETVDLRMDALMTRIEEKLDSMDDKINLEFAQLNENINNLNKKFEVLDKKLQGVDNLDQFVEKKITENAKEKAYNLVKWIVTVLLGGTAVTLAGKVVVSLVVK